MARGEEGGETIWLLLGVIILMGVMAAFSPGSTFSRAFLGITRSFENLFGSGYGYCPFVNPYALAIASAGELVVTGDHPLCDGLEYLYCKGSGVALQGNICQNADFKFDVTNGTCDAGELSIAISLTDEIKDNLAPVSRIPEGGPKQGSCFVRRDDGKWLYIENCMSYLKDYEITFGDEIPKDNKVAVSLLLEKRPMWQCFLIYGFLPFLILYHLLNDILVFAYMRTNTRRLIAVFGALLAVMTGAMANLIVTIAGFVGMSTGVSFLGFIFTMAIISIAMGQVASVMGVGAASMKAVQSAVTAAMIMRGTAAAFTPEEEESR